MIVEWTTRLQELMQQDLNSETDAVFKPIATEFEQLILSDKKEKLAAFLAEESDRTEEDFEYKIPEEYSALQELIKQYRQKKKEAREARAQQERDNYKKKTAILEKIKEITGNEENIGKAFNQFNELKDTWNTIGRVPGNQHKELMNDFHRVVDEFYYNISLYKDLKEYDFKKNLQAKKDLVTKLNTLPALTSIKELDQQTKAIQSEWYEIGPVPKDEFENLKISFKEALTACFNKIKELKDQLVKEQADNLLKKQELVAKAKEVVAEQPEQAKQWEKVTEELKLIQDNWKKIGFGPKKENEEVWQELRALCDDFFERKKIFYASFRDEQHKVKQQKEQLIEEAKKWQNSTDWKTATDKLLLIQKKWKNAGAASQRDENKLWKEFRSVCDVFFEAKKAHFKLQDESQKENLTLKEALIKELKAFKPEKGNNADAEKLKEYNDKWNAIGFIPKANISSINKSYENELNRIYEMLGLDKASIENEKFESKIKAWYNDPNGVSLIRKEQDFIRKKIADLEQTKVKYENNLGFVTTENAEKNPLLKGVLSKIEETNKAIEAEKEKLKTIRVLKPKGNAEHA